MDRRVYLQGIEVANCPAGLVRCGADETDDGTLFCDADDCPHRADAPLPPADPEKPWPDCCMLEAAWGIIANAWHGDWSKAPDEWREAATRWRDAYLRTLP